MRRRTRQAKLRAALSGGLLMARVVTAQEASPASFVVDIVPILTKAGCNAGACHGAATGQGGFRLSLLGYDPEEDYARITREFGGRRIDLDHPEESLLLRKPARDGIAHEGGRRAPRGSAAYEALRAWIANGAAYGDRDLRVTALDVSPAERWLEGPGQESACQLTVTATLSNGEKRDVTALALYSSNDDAVADVTPAGEVRPAGPGVVSIVTRFGGQVAAARVAIPFDRGAAALSGFEPRNFIDERISAMWKRLGLAPAEPATDGEYLRRVTLDVAGRLPTEEEARRVLSGAESRAETLERLLASDDFVDFWTLKLADLLRLGGARGASERAIKTYHGWLRDQVRNAVPWRDTVTALLLAEGELQENGPANFFTLASDPRDLAEEVGSLFLGVQIACARCHAHPTDRWTREDYHRFAAYFARVRQEGGAIRVSQRGEVADPKTGAPLSPKPLGASSPGSGVEGDRRTELAAWIGSGKNPWLAKAFVNRVWREFMGRGLVEPVNDLRPTNPATHPELLEELASRFTESGDDLRALIRWIAGSAVYQLGSRGPGSAAADGPFYSRHAWRALPAQVFLDAVVQVSGVPEIFPGHSPGTRAVELMTAEVPSYSLDVLGRCGRTRDCEVPGSSGGGLSQALHLINGEVIQGKLSGGILDELLEAGRDDATILETLYVRAFSRFPGPEELELGVAHFKEVGDRREAAQDMLWALLNSREFGFNH